ncbi:uncharacterized protein LOC116126283 [Pistacia vera]|uniref:uncharacterized protein LOC116126283 n=1 Tax=Pistacia vera TaxID=55513 RepID=UPI00126398C7|nr:uncharacterized protein LOC116126283 [Pistacia vera]
MTVLRSREILPTKPKTEPVKNGVNIEPATPSQTREAAAAHGPDSGSICRRSARLTSKSSVSCCADQISEQCSVKRKRKLGVNEGLLSSESGQSGGCLNLRSGKKVVKRKGEENVSDERVNAREMKGKSRGKLDFEVEDEKKGKIIENEEGVDMENFKTERIQSRSANCTRRFSREEKGKAKLVVEDSVLKGSDDVEVDLEDEVKSSADISGENVVGKSSVRVSESSMEQKRGVRVSESRMEQFRDIARQNASRFAFFSSEEQEQEQEQVSLENEREIEDWPGPFSTAMKIIRDRDDKLKRKHGTSSLENKKPTAITWIPKTGQGRSKLRIPSLKELCLKILVQNADAMTSLENVPDALRHKLTVMLCNSRRMNSHFLDLLVTGSPTEILLCECSWLTEEQFAESFQDCDTSNLTVLQLDYCGRLPDHIVLSTLVRSSKSLSSLTTLSLCGASRLSDVGLQGIVSSASALRCINLSQCCFVTATSINILANSLGSVMQELYINDCQNIDAMLILPALKKLKHLEVLSVARIETVSDDFIREFLSDHGHNMKELVLTECVKLTDISLKAIAETCTGLRALDIFNLRRLTDFSIGYLANGSPAIQKLNVGYNAFSDEAIAAFLETSGESMKELSLNSVKVAHNTAVSLAKRSRNLLSLDISFCRNLTNEAVGLIVDSCLSLKILKIFGCTQITNVFLEGHSNPEVQIIGMKMSPVLKFETSEDARL